MKKLLRALMVLSGLGCGGPTGCVARGSRIRVPGGTRLIESLQVGDEVLCAEPGTGALHVTRVTAMRRTRRECVRLGPLTLTADHPVYSPSDSSWAPAGDWALGTRTDLLVFETERAQAKPVERSQREAGVHEVFDLTVEHPLHNFIAEGILVHNKQPAPCFTDAGLSTGASCSCSDGGASTVRCIDGISGGPGECGC
jgi:hypothetical protein